MTVVDLLLVRHAESCGNIKKQTKLNDITHRIRQTGILHEPSLSIRGYIQSFYLRDYILSSKSNSITYDKVLCSPLIRTVVTAMIALSSFNNKENTNVIYIVPYVKFHTKKLSKINSVSELKDKIHNFKLWFGQSGIHLYQLYRETHFGTPNHHITSIHFPRIDYTALEDYERMFRENEIIRVTDEFHRYISSSLSISSVLIFTHKRFIQHIAGIKHEPKNTSILKMTFDTEHPTHNVTQVYEPSKKINGVRITRKYQIEQCKSADSFQSKKNTRKKRVH